MELGFVVDTADGRIGWRLSIVNLYFSLWSDSVFQNGYIKLNLLEFGGVGMGERPSLEVSTAVSFGYTHELSKALAWRVGELGVFTSLFAESRGKSNVVPFFDFGLTFSTGFIFR